MKKQAIAVALAALTFALVAGCQQSAPTTPPAPPPSQEREKDANIKIRGPRGGGVDVNTDGKTGETNVDVDIRRKGTRP